MSNLQSTIPSPIGKRYPIYLLVGLLVIREFIGIGSLLKIYQSDLIAFLFEFTIYAGLAILIYVEKERLELFHLDFISILLFLLFGTILRTNSSTSTIICGMGILFWIVGLILVVKTHRQLIGLMRKGVNLESPLIGGIIGAAVSIIVLTIFGKLKYFNPGASSFFDLIIQFVHQFSHAAILEEPIYRGFLWGYLKINGLKESYIWIIQAGLFWIAHINYFGTVTWIIAPIIGLILGVLAWRTRSISSSMTAHAIINWMRLIFPIAS